MFDVSITYRPRRFDSQHRATDHQSCNLHGHPPPNRAERTTAHPPDCGFTSADECRGQQSEVQFRARDPLLLVFACVSHVKPVCRTPLQAPIRHPTAHHSCITAYASACIPLSCNSKRRNKHFLAARSVKSDPESELGRGAFPKSARGPRVYERSPVSTFHSNLDAWGQACSRTRRPMLGWRLVGVSGRAHLSAPP